MSIRQVWAVKAVSLHPSLDYLNAQFYLLLQIWNSHATQYFNGYESMAMLGVWSLVFFGIMAAAELGGNSSCTRSNSQADKGKLHKQIPLQIHISVWVLQKPEELCNVEWRVPKTISFRKKVPRIISKWTELGWFPRQYCQCSSSRSMVHVSPPQKTAQHQMVQYRLSWRFNGDQLPVILDTEVHRCGRHLQSCLEFYNFKIRQLSTYNFSIW